MKNWFTIEQIDNGTYAVSEYGHWEETHCYLVCGSERAVLIDTGLGGSNIKAEDDRLTALPVTAVTTHVHWDHIGGHRYFEDIAVHEAEKEWLSGHFPLPLKAVKQILTCRPCEFPEDFELESYQIFQGTPRTVFSDGSRFDLGNRRLSVIHTPGHSPGHCCFYDAERGYLFSGDLIYRGCLDAFYPTTDPQLFYESVKKISGLSVSRILPGHHSMDVSPAMAGQVLRAFRELSEAGKLKQGSGVFDFGEFQIHI